MHATEKQVSCKVIDTMTSRGANSLSPLNLYRFCDESSVPKVLLEKNNFSLQTTEMFIYTLLF